MGKSNEGQGIGLAAIGAGVSLVAIGFVSIFLELPSTPPAESEIVLQAAAPAAAPVAATPEKLVESAPTAAGIAPQDELKDVLEGWRKAWSSRDIAAYLSFYVPEYQGNAGSPEKWQADRKRIIGQTKSIELQFGTPDIQLEGADRALLTFEIDYRSERLQDHGVKQLQLRRSGGRWLIEQEVFTAG